MPGRPDVTPITAIKPLGNRVIVRRDESRQPSNLIIAPQSAEEIPLRAEVLAVGPEVKSLKKGDVVLIGVYGGMILEDSKRLLLMREGEIYGIIKSFDQCYPPDGWASADELKELSKEL